MINMQKMWGATARLEFPPGLIHVQHVSTQFSDIRLPEPAVCSIMFQAYVAGGVGILETTTLDLVLGLGRAATTVSRSYLAQPTASVPLEILLPDQPFHSLLATVSGVGQSGSSSAPFIITTILQVAPISRLHQKNDPLSFGMQLPGEADGVDETTLEEAEATSPELVDSIRRVRDEQGSLMDLPDEGPDDPQARIVRPAPARDALIRRIIDTLTARQGTRPTRQQVRQALRAHDARRSRRA